VRGGEEESSAEKLDGEEVWWVGGGEGGGGGYICQLPTAEKTGLRSKSGRKPTIC